MPLAASVPRSCGSRSFTWLDFNPNAKNQAAAFSWGGRLQTFAATPGGAAAWMRMAFEIDVRAIAPAIAVPTLVLHRADDRASHVENGRFLGRTVPGARYVELPGDAHSPHEAPDDIVRRYASS